MAINREPQVFLFLSLILGKSIVGNTGDILGHVYDLSLIHISEPTRPY